MEEGQVSAVALVTTVEVYGQFLGGGPSTIAAENRTLKLSGMNWASLRARAISRVGIQKTVPGLASAIWMRFRKWLAPWTSSVVDLVMWRKLAPPEAFH